MKHSKGRVHTEGYEGRLAQLEERLVCNQKAGGSNPPVSTTLGGLNIVGFGRHLINHQGSNFQLSIMSIIIPASTMACMATNFGRYGSDIPSPTNETSKLQCSSVVFMVEVMIRTTPTHTANPAMKIPTYTPTFVETMVGSPTKTRVGSAGS